MVIRQILFLDEELKSDFLCYGSTRPNETLKISIS